MDPRWGTPEHTHTCSPGVWLRITQQINKEVPGKRQLSHSFDSWMVSFPGQKGVQIWITSKSQMPYLKDDRQRLIFGLRGEFKGVYVPEIIKVRHLKVKILCQPINIHECVKFPTAPFHSFHALPGERYLTLEAIAPLCQLISHHTVQSSFKTIPIFQLGCLYSPFLLKSTRLRCLYLQEPLQDWKK